MIVKENFYIDISKARNTYVLRAADCGDDSVTSY
jgi:hypothetical protein